ncbi:MAG: ABC transporter ATP-binding protein [Armatimonadetes bacterium]|nr:ABC transporter ATP-binding protein [Armatimonadota bacterium]MDW8027115.1 ABC transporter ATP-binding protein [Armatimonadota bacterium]
MVTLECTNLGKAFGRRWLFRRLSFILPHGTSLIILGPNGSGKTTMLRLLCGLLIPTEGHVIWKFGETKLTPIRARFWLGAVLPDCEPYEELTAEENLQMVAELKGIHSKKVGEWFERIGLVTARGQLVREFSSGMKLRLKVAMALIHEPFALLLDEPTAMLDEAGRKLVGELIEEQKQRGVVVIATNDERDVAYGDQQIILGERN